MFFQHDADSLFRNIRTDSALFGQKLSLSTSLLLIFYLSVKSLTDDAISQLWSLSTEEYMLLTLSKGLESPSHRFTKWRPIAELKIVDPDQFRYYLDSEDDAASLMKCSKRTLSEETYNLSY
ncbi:hypothetical protein ACHWQZ_G014280 [Mnemiopsis leidyi]